jgi:hypothetical protein
MKRYQILYYGTSFDVVKEQNMYFDGKLVKHDAVHDMFIDAETDKILMVVVNETLIKVYDEWCLQECQDIREPEIEECM